MTRRILIKNKIGMITQTNKKVNGREPNLEFQKKVVDLYDSSYMYSYNSVAAIMQRSPQRIQQIHKAYKHNCPRIQKPLSRTAPVAMEEGVDER